MAPAAREGTAERRARKRELRAKLAELRARLRLALSAKRQRMRELTGAIRSERVALRDRLRAHRRRALEELRASARAERGNARAEWQRRRTDALREAISDVERARVELAAERERQKADRRVEAKLRADAAAHARTRREQSDEEVRGMIPRGLVPLFDRIGRSIRGGTSHSRAEAFLRYAEKHPEVTFAAVEARAHEHIEDTRGAIAEVARAAARGQGVPDYAAKRAARIERMYGKAERLQGAADQARAQARSVADRIPLGQPILVGHHSQRRHERDLERMRRSFGKSVELARDAEALADRARRAEKGRTVSSDDPDALDKLREKLGKLNASRERMRAANAAIRGGGDVIGTLRSLGFSDEQARKLVERDFAGRIGFPDYALRNAAGEAARVERRIRELEQRAATPAPASVVIGDATISEAENRVRVTFPAVPPDAVRRALKGAGFRWAPSAGAWQRHASNGAWHAAKAALAGFAEGGAP